MKNINSILQNKIIYLKDIYESYEDDSIDKFYLSYGLSLVELFYNGGNDSKYLEYILRNVKKINGFSVEYGLANLKGLINLYSLDGKSYSLLRHQLEMILRKAIAQLNKDVNTLNYQFVYGQITCIRHLIGIDDNAIEYMKKLVHNRYNLVNHFKNDLDKMNEEERKYFPNGYVDLGLAHGLSGLLTTLCDYYVYSNDKQALEIINDIYILIIENCNYFKDCNTLIIKGTFTNDDLVSEIKSEYYSWCYGTLGIITALQYSNKIVYSSKIEKILSVFSKTFFEKVELDFKRESNSICHGYVGAYLMLSQVFGDKFLKSKLAATTMVKIENLLNVENDEWIKKGFSHIDGCISELMIILVLKKNIYKDDFCKYFLNIS